MPRSLRAWDYDNRSSGRNIISPYKHISLIYNPFAGGLRGAKIERLERAEKAMREFAETVTREPTTAPRTAGAIAHACAARGSDLIVAAGGDGTINEVVEGMAGCSVPLAILPAGTANVLASEMRLGPSMERAARRIPQFVARRIPLGCLAFPDGSSRHFLLMAGAGLDAQIVFNLNYSWKARWGKLAYYLCAFRQFGRSLEEFQVETNGRRYDCSFALISKVRNYGGDLEIAQEVSLIDKCFEVVLFRGSNSFRYFLYLGGVATRLHKLIPGVKNYRAREIQLLPLKGDHVHLQVDGEYAGLLPATIQMIPDSLTLLMPPGYPAKLNPCDG